ncbi:MAG: B12-binding domain-containing radical SAM protein [Chloroflexi bacterium]|nr:B12-binding domain-containing radical SAM protein [Chloroflexota bacterium]
MNRRPDLLLVFPPFWDCGTPYLSVPTLAAYIKHQGFEVEAVDLNRASMKALLTPGSLSGALQEAQHVLNSWPSSDDAAGRRAFEENLRVCQQIWSEMGESLVADLWETIPSSVDSYTAFNRRWRWASRIAVAPYRPVPQSTDLAAIIQEHDRLRDLCEAVERGELPGVDLLDAFAARNAARSIPVLGISVAGPSQLLPALVLARAYKSRAKDAFVCIGGPHIPYITDALQDYSKPFDWVDAFVVGEGELPLSGICRNVIADRDIFSIKGLYLRRGDRVIFTGCQDPISLDELPPPDFTGFEPDSYLANDGSICLTFARGCSWSRCAFCTQFVSYDGYRTMSSERVAEHLSALTGRYSLRTISLNDENVTPERLRDFASIVRRNSTDLRWMALARLSPKLADANLARKLFDSGCRMLSMGLESADQGVLKLNKKGVSVRSVPSILRNLNGAGIWTHIFIILGLPGETSDSAVRTIRFIHRNLDFIDSFSPTTFRLERHSTVWQRPSDFGIVPAEVPADWCSISIPFDTTTWTRPGEAFVFTEFLIQSLLGYRQCSIEQGDLNGQYLLQMLDRMGAEGLREEMRKRARMTAAARDALMWDDARFQEWLRCPSARRLQSDANGHGVLFSIPSRSLFLSINSTGQMILKLRSLGLSLEKIKKMCHLPAGGSVDAGTEQEWRVDTFNLLLLVSRLIQESLPEESTSTECPSAESSFPESVAASESN